VFDLTSAVHELRRSGTDSTRIEVKRAAGGFPDSLLSTMSALANLPGGGVVILGLDEAAGFSPVALPDVAGLIEALVSKARQSFVPPISLNVEDVEFEGYRVIVAEIDETLKSAKPCRLKSGGAAYLRFADGDFQLSDVEIQGFWTSRDQPRSDLDPVPGTSIKDLDIGLTDRFIESLRDGDERYRQYTDRTTVLMKSGVLDSSGVLTVAGLLALGDLPQQWFPNFVIQASAAPSDSDPADTRVGDRARFSGPIPAMIDQAIAWTRQHSRRRTRENTETGVVSDSFDLPPVAMRELFANAVVHRDVAPWSQSRAIELRITDQSLKLTNPGGLFGVTADRLGRQQLSSARNAHLLRICQFIGLADGNAVEALATGIPKILAAIADAGLKPPVFFDQALSFTATIDRRAITATSAPSRPVPGQLSAPELRVLAALGDVDRTTRELVATLGVSPDWVRKALRTLMDRSLVTRTGGRGSHQTTYRRVPN
jgi:ATP-dependent DNA helicase RecG